MILIYLDNHSTTPCDPRVIAEMLPYFSESYGNPSNALHFLGRQSAAAIGDARAQVAKLVSAPEKGVVFTSGATEANNLAILGLARTRTQDRTRIVTTQVEHKSVLSPIRALAGEGFDTVLLPVDQTGRVDVEAATHLIDSNTLLVSIQAANSEIGTIQPVNEIAQLAHRAGAIIHCDASQTAGKIPTTVLSLETDLLSLSAHKMYGPKGVGALVVRNQKIRKSLVPLLFGGSHEWSLRPGTENVPGIVGFGKACEICISEMNIERCRTEELRDRLESDLRRKIEKISFNGDGQDRLPGNSSVTLPGVAADALLLNLPELALSTGSACNSGSPGPSLVLTAIGLSREDANSTFRIGIGRFNTIEEIHHAPILIADAYERLLDLP